MPLFLYDLPNWLFGSLIVVCWAGVGLGGHALFHRLCRVHFPEADRNLAITLLAVVATVNSLLLAFSAISVWEAYGKAESAVSSEATVIGELGRDLAVFGSPESRLARERLKAYARVVLAKEWPAMQGEQASPPTWDAFEGMFRAVGDIRPASPYQMTLMPEIWARVNEMIEYRHDRLEAAAGQVPATLWAVVLLGTLLTLLPSYVLPRTAFNRAAIGLLSVSMGLVFFFVAAMDRPFAGHESVSPAPIVMTLGNMERWDTQTEALASAHLAAR